ncbi:hypothetical protein MCOR14_012117 [Pyricularia oryzae]|nr:hypothetical protein MCOR30_011856 [Pyricularia oryzae]KAI6374165.1 hypothetical protein MCOR32_011771 [Pyricularia oryzae]KAI6510326.1 hypothetical protein MCOR13_011942 [Pyricularia oryzae]KAI6533677.1 hypothetical protein MCOR16_011963 [Pyricularia oryzae]KAI6638230.1 hypothetical protein MCOR14_012117 [Pyricularia oryzae]
MWFPLRGFAGQRRNGGGLTARGFCLAYCTPWRSYSSAFTLLLLFFSWLFFALASIVFPMVGNPCKMTQVWMACGARGGAASTKPSKLHRKKGSSS